MLSLHPRSHHRAETYNQLNAKYGKGLYWILAGDTNDLKLDPILHLSPNLKSVVTKPTRLNPDRVLDNIIKDLPKWYQTPECLPTLEADPGSGGKQSDHLIITMTPTCTINNKTARTARVINVRPMKQSGIDLFGEWLNKQTWKEVLEAETLDEKAEMLQNMLVDKFDEFLSHNDSPSNFNSLWYLNHSVCEILHIILIFYSLLVQDYLPLPVFDTGLKLLCIPQD